MSELLNDQDLPHLPPRDPTAHKGSFGRVLVIAGSRGMVGAACLATTAALRAGAGLVTLATAETAQTIAATRVLSALTVPLPETEDGSIAATARGQLTEALGTATQVALGPGLTTDAQTRRLVLELVRDDLAVPTVLDADGLNCLALAGAPGLAAIDALAGRAPCVLTPHPGEMARLIEAGTGEALGAREVNANRVERARAFVEKHNVILVLKGAGTVIACRDGCFVSRTGNVGLATGGSGDVLTGMIVGLLAQGLSALEAARLGVYLHGRAGELATETFGVVSMIAEDLLATIAPALRELHVVEGQA